MKVTLWPAVLVGLSSLLLLVASIAGAHPADQPYSSNSVVAGAVHCLTGLDHLLAILATGLLAVRVDHNRAIWIVPGAFAALVLVGAALAFAGLPSQHSEWGTGLSVIVLGLGVATVRSIPLGAGAAVVGLFAVFHGHAHVAELGESAPLPYMFGLIIVTLAVHALAIGAGLLAISCNRPRMVRFAGGAVAATFTLTVIAA